MRGGSEEQGGSKMRIGKNRKPKTVDTVEREREREPLFIQRGIRLLDHTHTHTVL